MNYTTSLFRSANLRLTVVYVSILSLICLFFSYNWYQIATSELKANVLRQDRLVIGNPRFFNNSQIPEFIAERDRFIRESIDNIRARIILSNFIILGLGACGSYILAKRTLQPIEEAHETQKQFTADASHELRTPLAAMRTEIEVALRDKGLKLAEAKELLNSNLEELQKITKLSENLLELARQDSRQMQFNLSKQNLSHITEEAVSEVLPLAKHKSITISKPDSDYTVIADPQKMKELFVILLENGIKYSSENTKITIQAVRASKAYVRVSIADEGFGIDPRYHERIFDRFYRLDMSRSKQKIDGHGLGLSIAKTIAEAHGTTVAVKSRAGEGSTFSFSLKLAP